MGPAAEIRVLVVYSPGPRAFHEWPVVVAAGATVLQALQNSPVAATFPELDLPTAVAGVWGRKTRLDQRVREGDRIEIYRPLEVDPKVARRERFRKQGARAAGLFTRKKSGS
jgi:putative ubiquitin-RnfH superfamily antitoxin RatB of RatAB toxin-antitoxin module